MNKLFKTIYKTGLIRLSFAIGLLIFSMGAVQAQSDADFSAVYTLPTEQLIGGEQADQVLTNKIVEIKEAIINQQLADDSPEFRLAEMEMSYFSLIQSEISGTVDLNSQASTYNSVAKAVVNSLQIINENFPGGVSVAELSDLRSKAITLLKK